MSVISDKWSGEKEDEEVTEMSYLLFLEDILLEKKTHQDLFQSNKLQDYFCTHLFLCT